MSLSDKEKAKLGAEGIKEFLDQFGNPSTHTYITLSVLFEELLRWGDKPDESSDEIEE